MRLFAGIPLDLDTRALLAGRLEGLRGAGWPIRWVSPAAWHLTVRFYGERDAADVARIGSGLAEALRGTPALDLHLTTIGTNAMGPRARVLWVEVEAPAGLELLHDRVERSGAALGIEPEGRPYRPHLTIGRVRDGAALPPDAGPRLAGVTVDLPFLADRLVLFESVPGRGGPTYTARATFPLERAA